MPRSPAETAGVSDLGASLPTWGDHSRLTKAVETHISVLVFIGDRVYKLRKPVQYEFVDFTSRAAREADCHREVALNRRFAPDVYLGVLDIEDRGHLLDHMVVMRRLAEDARLSAMATEGRLRSEHLDEIVATLLRSSREAERSTQIDEFARRDAIAGAWKENIDEVATFVGDVLDRSVENDIESLVWPYLEGRARLFDDRIAGGWIRDGHGDLRAEDIFCLDDGPRILDCVEFDDRLRFVDVLADLAFLVMDLEYLGCSERAHELVETYVAYSSDPAPRSLLWHYCAQRAYVRAKVACLALRDEVRDATEEARAYHSLCLAFLERAQVSLTLVGGLPGSGKSTLATSIAEQTGADVLRSDLVRREIYAPSTDSSAERYSPAATAATYDAMIDLARGLLERGQSVILDATWSSEMRRERARRVAALTESELRELHCVTSSSTTERRIRERQSLGLDPSEATVEIARKLALTEDPWPSARSIDTSGAPGEATASALEAFESEHSRGFDHVMKTGDEMDHRP